MISITKRDSSKINTMSINKQIISNLILFILLNYFIQATIYGSDIPMLNTSQFHFIPQGSCLQLSIDSAQINSNQFSSLTFSQILGSLSFGFIYPQVPVYNILYLPSSNQQSENTYQCYIRAASGGLSQQSCQFSANFTSPEINCQQCLTKAFSSNDTVACLNCSGNISVDVSELTKRQQFFLENGTMLIIIDNSPVISKTSSKSEIELQVGYEISIKINEQLSSVVYLFCIIIGVVVVILCVIAGYVTLMIKKYDKDIQQQKKKNQ